MRDVKVSLSDLDVAAADESVQSADERVRASKFRFERDRRRFVACRLALRQLLAQQLGIDPDRIEFSYGPFGKPSVRGLYFNASHSDSLAIFAVSRTREVGVDIERVQPEIARELAPDFSCCEEQFFEMWTRREAVAKACGIGIGREMIQPADSWELETFRPAEGYIASVAASLSTVIFR